MRTREYEVDTSALTALKRKREPAKHVTSSKKAKRVAAEVRLFSGTSAIIPPASLEDNPATVILAARKTWNKKRAANVLLALANYCKYLQSPSISPDAQKSLSNLVYTRYDLYKLAKAWGCSRAQKKLAAMTPFENTFFKKYEKFLREHEQALLHIEETPFSLITFANEINDVMHEIQTYFCDQSMSLVLQKWFSYLSSGKAEIAVDIAEYASKQLEEKVSEGLSL